MKKLLLLILLLDLCTVGFSQKEDQKWIFNYTSQDLIDDTSSIWGPTVLDFNKLPPLYYRDNDIVLDFSKTNTIICDSLGQILLYSNGMSVYGPDHSSIINGEQINYGEKWELLTFPENLVTISLSQGFKQIQNALILPIPEDENNWLLLSHNYENRDFNLLWPDTDFFELKKCQIELNQNNKFEIVEKDVTINDKILKNGCLTATRHANGRDWWFLQFNKDTVYTYLVDPLGVNLSHTQILPFKVYDSGGQSKFNQQGTAFAFMD